MGAKQSLEFRPLFCGMQLTQLGAVTGSLLPPLPSCSMSQTEDGCSPELLWIAGKGLCCAQGAAPQDCGMGVSRKLAEGRDLGLTLSSWEGLWLGCCLGCVSGSWWWGRAVL